MTNTRFWGEYSWILVTKLFLMWGYRAFGGQLLGYLIEDLSESFDASMVDRCSRKWQCSSPENQIACHISIYFSWYSVSQILQMQARPNPSILSVFLEVWVTLWPERILGHSAACSTDFPTLEPRPTPSSKETALPMALHYFMTFYVRFTDGRNHWYKPGAFSPISRIFLLMLLILFWLNRFLFYV